MKFNFQFEVEHLAEAKDLLMAIERNRFAACLLTVVGALAGLGVLAYLCIAK